MQRSTTKRRVATAAPQAAIVLKPATGRDERTRLGLALLVFMRILAAVWLVQGLLQWGTVLGTGAGGSSRFSALTPAAMAAAVFFAVVNFVAAVGLWLAAPWGGVIWLVAVFAQLARRSLHAGLLRPSASHRARRCGVDGGLLEPRLVRRPGTHDARVNRPFLLSQV